MVPSKAKFVTYYRVSTLKQGQSGLGLEAQKSAVKDYIDNHSGVELATFKEVESGKLNTRPQLEAALLRCRQSHATLLVAKLDRLSRNAAFLFNLRDSGVKFQALDIPEANTLTLGVMAVLAQHEREIISARTRAALAARRARGLPLGTPRDMSAHAARASALACAVNARKARSRAALVAPAIKSARAAGCASLRQVAEHLDELGITTPRGKSWTPTAVKNAEKLIATTRSRSRE
jgi:DNA invertase Pin-like site-specific DNA recombinase